MVSCWGRSNYGQVGAAVDAGASCQRPTAVTGITNATLLAAGFGHVCVRKDDNTVWCWGLNSDGQLGHDPSLDPMCPSTKCSPTPAKVNGLPQ
jgi:alpha-tubulin suppressor-like RCC1 family protein